MQYNININQKQLVELSNEIGVKINLKTATVLNYFKEAHTVFSVKIINKNIYYKVEYKKVLEQNPLLDIGEKQLSRHFDKLVEMGILKKEIIKGEGTETYFAPDLNYIKCFFEFQPQDKNVQSTGQKSSVPQDKNVQSYIETYNKKHKTNNISILTDFFEKNDLKEIVKQTIIPLENQVWNDDQATATLDLVKESMVDYFKNKKKLIKNPKATFKNWILKHKKTDFYKYQNSNNPVGRCLPDTNQNQNIETFTWSATNRTFVNHLKRIVYYDPVDFDYNTEKIEGFLKEYKKNHYIIKS